MNERSFVRVYVDERERSSFVPRMLTKLGVYVVFKQLSVGDYLVSEDTVIERKTVEDLVRSVFDGRLFDQAKRISEVYATPILLVEGDVSLVSRVTSRRKQVTSALMSIMLDYGFKVVYTKSQEETAEVIAFIARKLQQPRPTRIVIHKKPKLSTIDEWQLYIVQSLPYVGPKTAYRLLSRFGSVEKVFTASAAELSRIEGIGESKARMIVRVLKTPFMREQGGKRVSLQEFVEG